MKMKEEFYEFHKGDRVVAVVDRPSGLPIYMGEFGTVLKDTRCGHFVPVCFDNYDSLRHDCDGLCDYGHGFWAYPKQLSLHEEENLDPWSEEDWGVIFGELSLREVAAS